MNALRISQSVFTIAAIVPTLLLCITQNTLADTDSPFMIKTVAAINYLYSSQTLQQGNFHNQGEKIAEDAAFFIATKTDTQLDGPFTYLFENVDPNSLQQANSIQAKLGWPVKTLATKSAPYEQQLLGELKCLTLIHKGPSKDVISSWQKLYNEALTRGLKFNGQARAVIKLSSNTGYVITELQLGIL